MAKPQLEKLLSANPAAKKHETVIRETLQALRQMHQEGFGGEGYRLVPPFGEKQFGLKQASKRYSR
jgi:hypothetical protein